jgi:three-Cys-motif partner protein
MLTHEYGGDWTAEKLERIRKYLHAYTTIFRGNVRARALTTTYVDAFAGTGYRLDVQDRPESPPSLFPELVQDDARQFQKGSAKVALEVEPGFDKYVLVEKDVQHAQELQTLKTEFPAKASSIFIVCCDANDYLQGWCQATNWSRSRAVVFLDPYGMQVDWATVVAIAETKAIDLWLLFPLGMAVNRLLTRAGPPPEAWERKLTRFFGTEDWKTAFYQRTAVPMLFGDEEMFAKDTDYEAIGRYFVSRLKTVFAGVAENPLPLRNARNVPLYLLCFAAGNARGAETAVKIAGHILGR